MDVDYLEDSESSESPLTQEDLPLGSGVDSKISGLDWDLPSFGGRQGNLLELYDGGLDGFQSTKFSFTGEGYTGLSSLGFDALPDFGSQTRGYEADPLGLNDAFSAPSLAGQTAAFEHIGMAEDMAPATFASSAETYDTVSAGVWPAFDTSTFIQPADLQPVPSVASAPSVELQPMSSESIPKALPLPLAPPLSVSSADGDLVMPPVLVASTSAGPKLKKRSKEVYLPPVASQSADVAGKLGLLVLGLKADSQAEPERAYHSRVETSLRLHIALVGATGDPSATRPAPETDAFGTIPAYSDSNGILRAEIAQGVSRVTNYRYIKLDKISPVFKRDHFDPPADETLYMETHIYFASHPDQTVPFKHQDTRCNARATKGCIPRELKRWHERVNGNRRSQTDAKEELLTGLDTQEANAHFEKWIEGAEALMYNDAEVQDFSEGCTSVQLRVLHYARCFSDERQQGYFLVFTLRNHLGQVLAQSSTPSIFMTDNHKGSSAKTSGQQSPVDSMNEELAGSSRVGRRAASTNSGRRTGTNSRSMKRSTSSDSAESRASSKRAAEPSSTEAKRRKSSGFASRSSLCMTPRDAPLSGLASPTAREQRLSAPASPGALHAELARMPLAKRETSPSTETSSSALSPPATSGDVLAGLQQAEMQAPLVPPQRSRTARPRIEDVIPTEGSVRGGSRIAVIGSAFRQGAVVYFGLTPAQTEFRGSSSLICTLPPAPAAGPVRVSFGADSTEDPIFTYLDDTEQTLTAQSVGVVAAMLGLTSLDLTARFEEIRRGGGQSSSGKTTPNGQIGNKLAMSPATRTRRASISDDSQRRPVPVSAHSRTKSLTDLTNLGDLPPPPPRKKGLLSAEAPLEDQLVALFELPARRLAPHVLAQAIIRGATHEGQNVLHLAAILGYDQLVDLLIARGAPLDLVDANGMTALHFAALHARLEVIRSLIEGGAPTGKRNSEGLTPFKVAEDVLEREDVMEAFPLSARARSMPSSRSSLASYFASGSDWSEEVGESDVEGNEEPIDEHDDAEEEADEAITNPLRSLSRTSSLSERNLLSRGALPSRPDPVKSDDEDTLVGTASVATARPKKGSKWFQLVDTENVFWSPISTAWWQPRRAEEAPQTIEGPPAPRMYGPSEATTVRDKAMAKKPSAAAARRVGYESPRPSPPAEAADADFAFPKIQKHRTLWHDRRLFLIWIPSLLLAFAYFLHSAALLPGIDLLEIIIPQAVLAMR